MRFSRHRMTRLLHINVSSGREEAFASLLPYNVLEMKNFLSFSVLSFFFPEYSESCHPVGLGLF